MFRFFFVSLREQISFCRENKSIFEENENLLADIDQTGSDNFKMARKCFGIKDFYDTNLVP